MCFRIPKTWQISPSINLLFLKSVVVLGTMNFIVIAALMMKVFKKLSNTNTPWYYVFFVVQKIRTLVKRLLQD